MNEVTKVLPPTRCEGLESMVARAGGSIDWQHDTGAGVFHYELPAHASGEIRESWGKETFVEAGRSYVARLPGGRVFGSGHVISPDGAALAREVSSDLGKAAGEHWLLSYREMRPAIGVSGVTGVAAVNLGAGYGHWLLEELPRLLALAGTELGQVIAHTAHTFHREALQALEEPAGIPGRRRVLPATRAAHRACEQLVIPSLVGAPGFPVPRTVTMLTGAVAPLLAGGAGWGERLYLSREHARRRHVVNEDLLWPQLAARGFAKIHLEALSWRQQVNAFAQAKVIVGPHGAGLANLVFCEPGTRIVEFFNREYVNGCYWRLAALKGLDYRPLVPPGDEGIAETAPANREPITADIPAILRAAG